MEYSAFYISKSKYELIYRRITEKTTTNKIRYNFNLYLDESTNNYVFSHLIDLSNSTHYKYKLIAKDMRLDLGFDQDGLHIIHKSSARGRSSTPLTILN